MTKTTHYFQGNAVLMTGSFGEMALQYISNFHFTFYHPQIMRNIFLFVTIFTAITLTAGCSGDIATLRVTGTVTFDGEPLANANVNFTPKSEGQGHPAYAITDANGFYRLQTLLGAAEAGTTPGDYDVYIISVERGEIWSADPSGTSPTSSGSMGPPRSIIPERYSSAATSGLSATVERGKPNVFNFDLTR
jgi:hypothetical protein